MFQTAINLTDTPRTEYNGWSDWTTWNCALWIGGDEGFYNLAKDYRNYGDFVNCIKEIYICLLYTSPSPRDNTTSRMPSSA